MPFATAPADAAGPEPLDGLLCRFWEEVRADLVASCPTTLAWLDSADFDWWARTTLDSIEPEQVRRRLLAGTRPPAPARG